MTSNRRLLSKLFLSTCLIGVSFAGAQAQDVNVVAERFKQVIAEQNVDVSWTSVTSGPSSMVLEGVKIAPVGADKPAEIGKLTFEGISEDSGTFEVESIKTEAFSTTEDGATIELSPVSMNGSPCRRQGRRARWVR